MAPFLTACATSRRSRLRHRHPRSAGGFGADTVIGGTGEDVFKGSALGDVLFGRDKDYFVTGGFGYDRANGGAGANAFFHLGIADHGPNWIRNYDAAEGDALVFGNTDASRAQFQINTAATPTVCRRRS